MTLYGDKWFKPENNYVHGYIKVMLRNFPVFPGNSQYFLLSWKILVFPAFLPTLLEKPNSTLGFLKRNIKPKQPKVREMAYNTLVCPQLEYASPIWDPDTKGKILQIEKVQRRAACWTINDFDTRSSITGMLDNLGWKTLEQRQTDAPLYAFSTRLCTD